MSSIIIQPHVKKRIRPEDLIQIGEDVKAQMTKEQITQDVETKTRIFLKRWQQ